MSRNFLPLIELLVEEITKSAGGVSAGQAAMEIMGTTGSVTPTGLSETLATTREFIALGIISGGSTPLSCGATANALCQIFVGANDLANTCATVGDLKAVVTDGKQRLIRIDLSGHSYVIEQVATSGRPLGNVYQSNIAVVANPDLGIGTEEYIKEHTNPVRLTEYLDEVAVVSSGDTPPLRRASAYNHLYTTNKATPSTGGSFTPEVVKKVAVYRLSWGYFTEDFVLKRIDEIFASYGNALARFRAKAMFFGL